MSDKVEQQPLNGWQKRDIVEDSLKSGDAVTANNQLHTIKDQKLFMDLLASKAQTDLVPGLVITADKDGTVHQIKSDKLTISDAGGQLNAKANHTSVGEYLSAKWDAITSFGSGVKETVKDAAKQTDLGDALSKSGTSESLLNQNINRRIEAAEKGTKN